MEPGSTTRADEEPVHSSQAEPHAQIRESANAYGTAEVNEFGTDLSMLRRNLCLTPTERLRNMAAFVQFLQTFQRPARLPER